MVEVFAQHKFARISPQKARRVIDLIRGKKAIESLAILQALPQYKGSRLIFKVLQSAVANATHNYGLSKDKLMIAKAFVDEGPRAKRLLPRAFGRAHVILKRHSHISVVVKEKD